MRRSTTAVTVAAIVLSLGLLARSWAQSPDTPIGSPSGADTSAQRTETQRPHGILLITVDTLRADHLSAYGYTRRTSPRLDRLAAEGVLFERAVAQYSQTNPSHATIMTGTYPATHGLRLHGVDTLKASLPTLAEVLSTAGYRTAGIYSWPTLGGTSGLDRGFESYQEVVVPALERDRDVPELGLHTQYDGRASVTSDAAIAWIQQAGPTPFFLWVHYQDPHFPYEPPQPYDQSFGVPCPTCPDGGSRTILDIASGHPPDALGTQHLRDLYDGEIAFTDHEIGRLLDALQTSGLGDRTLIVITADHGESFGDNGQWSHPWIVYDSVVRVPVILKYAPAVPAGRSVPQVARHMDIMPTVLELVGVANPLPTEGASLVPLAQGLEQETDRDAVVETLDFARLAIVRGHWKLILETATGSSVLHDLDQDPAESTNVAAANPDLSSDLTEAVAEPISWGRESG